VATLRGEGDRPRSLLAGSPALVDDVEQHERGLRRRGDGAGPAGKARDLHPRPDRRRVCEEAGIARSLEANGGLEALMAAIRRGEPLIVAEGAPARAFELRAGGPHALGQALADLRPPHAGARALVGGFARHDCVACATQVLAGIGWTASICERTAWPPSLWASPRTSGRGGLVSPAVNDSRVAKAQTPSLAKSLGDLRDLSDEELIRQHTSSQSEPGR
jgi:hypothetical protein